MLLAFCNWIFLNGTGSIVIAVIVLLVVVLVSTSTPLGSFGSLRLVMFSAIGVGVAAGSQLRSVVYNLRQPKLVGYRSVSLTL